MSLSAKMLSVNSVIKMLKVAKTYEFKNGILIGVSSNFNSLAYFDPYEAQNKHIFVCGSTGSGKSFLLRSLAIRLSDVMDEEIHVIDFTNEYSSLAGHGIYVYNLSKERQDVAVMLAEDRLRKIFELAKSLQKGRFIIIDEFWKLIEEGSSLEKMIREARKYGIGIVLSSQSYEDMDESIRSNFASLFLFRSREKHNGSYVPNEYEELCKDLAVGSCILISDKASGGRKVCFVKRVIGVNLEEHLCVKVKDMEVLVEESKIRSLIKMAGEGEADKMVKKAKENGFIRLEEIVECMISAKLEDKKIIEALRSMGISYQDIADAFAVSISKLSNGQSSLGE
ncbi:MAG: ATP-binding protein [Candidatus Micrarchaeaceae archaeon]